MSDKNFYLSELAFEMLIASQSQEKMLLPARGVLKRSSTYDLHTELYSLVSNNIIHNSEREKEFVINEEVASIIKCIISSKAVLKVVQCRYPGSPVFYYLSENGIAKITNNELRKGIMLGFIDKSELCDSIITELDLPYDYQNTDTDTERFINEIDSVLRNDDNCICTDMMTFTTEEMKKALDGISGYVDLILTSEIKAVKRTVAFRKAVYYKIAEISEETINISNYSSAVFSVALDVMTGEYL